MDSRKAGGLFLTQIFISIGVSLWLSFGNPTFHLGIIPNLLFSQFILFLPAFLFLVLFRENPARIVSFRPIKFSTCLFTLLYTFLMTPLITAVNAFSMLFSNNMVMEIDHDILAQPALVMILIMGMLGPFNEEFVFRGVIFGSFRKTGRVLPAIVLQAFLFGLMHLNLNQFCYAFVIGIAIGMLVEVTGSIWSGFVMHAAINTTNVGMLYLSNSLTKYVGETLNESYTSDMLIIVMCIYMGIALVTTSIAACVLVAIAKNETRMDKLKQMFTRSDKQTGGSLVLFEPVKKESLMSVPTVIAILICFTVMIAQEVLRRMFS